MPRLKTYSYMILIPPALVALQAMTRTTAARIIGVITLCLPVRLLFEIPVVDMAPLSTDSWWALVAFYPWFLALVLWWLAVSGRVSLRRPTEPQTASSRQ
jgi:hypothetical protein